MDIYQHHKKHSQQRNECFFNQTNICIVCTFVNSWIIRTVNLTAYIYTASPCLIIVSVYVCMNIQQQNLMCVNSKSCSFVILSVCVCKTNIILVLYYILHATHHTSCFSRMNTFNDKIIAINETAILIIEMDKPIIYNMLIKSPPISCKSFFTKLF